MRENALERLLREEVARRGGLVAKLDATNNRGVPDRVVLLPGRHVTLVELKQEGEDPAPHQEHWHEKAFRAGHKVVVLRGSEEIRRWVR